MSFYWERLLSIFEYNSLLFKVSFWRKISWQTAFFCSCRMFNNVHSHCFHHTRNYLFMSLLFSISFDISDNDCDVHFCSSIAVTTHLFVQGCIWFVRTSRTHFPNRKVILWGYILEMTWSFCSGSLYWSKSIWIWTILGMSCVFMSPWSSFHGSTWFEETSLHLPQFSWKYMILSNFLITLLMESHLPDLIQHLLYNQLNTIEEVLEMVFRSFCLWWFQPLGCDLIINTMWSDYSGYLFGIHLFLWA